MVCPLGWRHESSIKKTKWRLPVCVYKKMGSYVSDFLEYSKYLSQFHPGFPSSSIAERRKKIGWTDFHGQ